MFGVLVACMLAVGGHLARLAAPPHRTLPAVSVLLPLVPALLTVALLAEAGATGLGATIDGTTGLAIFLAGGVTGAVAAATESRHLGRRPKRIAVIGSAVDAGNLALELQHAGCDDFEVIGCIAIDGVGSGGGSRIGGIAEVGALVEEHELDLLLLSSSAPRMDVFRQLATACPGSSVRALELTAFYERTLGHVPVGAINDAWFQCVMHPEWTGTTRVARVRDVIIASIVAVLAAPLLAILALIIRRDGGPALYRQVRIGEGGRPFEIYKLRSMSVTEDAPAAWSSAADPRVTPIGRFIRKTHLDEIPQVFNVLRGDMSIVGPRPEQPEMVEQLEQAIPFYSRRHFTRPGITGWAQVHCGYSGSELGSAWKLSHDLYYLRHRSEVLDLMILFETLRMLVNDRQYGVAPSGLQFVLPETPRIRKAS